MKNELVKLLIKLITKNKNKSPISVRGLVIRILEIRFDNEPILGSAMIQKNGTHTVWQPKATFMLSR